MVAQPVHRRRLHPPALPGLRIRKKHTEHTCLARLDDAEAIFTAACHDHDDHALCTDPVDGGYLDLATLNRNLDKERSFACDTSNTAQDLRTTHGLAPRRPHRRRHLCPRDMPIYKRYYDLIANGSKTIEVRVAYTSMLRIKVGDQIRFTCRDENTLTLVKRVTRYNFFDEMFDHERAEAINSTAGRNEQLKAIRDIFPPEKEALGVLAIEVERVSSR